ncbi:DUF6023 family protein [Pseudarthrobacter sp. H2]|uniref:DUF6023 family protein n=1 Tax=Pseudarthrobacter sp. H2 TaxID=3418415 RepID=UPI003CF22D0F
MPPVLAKWVPRQRTAAAAVVLLVALLLGSLLTGCEYVDEDNDRDEGTAAASAPPSTSAALPQDPALSQPVAGAELDMWVKQVLPNAEGQVFHTGSGSLVADAERSETTGQLPSGTYTVTLACRSTSRVSFSVRNGEEELIDLNLRCGTSRVNVVTLAADTVLTVTMEAINPANFAYRVNRI